MGTWNLGGGTPEIFDYILHYSIQRVNKVLRLSKLYLIRKSFAGKGTFKNVT